PTLRNGTFRALTNLVTLQLSGCNVSEIENDAFDGLTNLTSLYLNFNDIEDLEVGVFRTLSRLIYLGLWNSRLKTLRRNPFGPNITTIATIDLDGNVVNSLERSLFDDLTGLNLLYFTNNLCASGVFSGFIANRLEFMQRLERCFRNFELIIDTVTDNNVDYLFFRGENPGIVARVQAEDEIQIALTPFNFPWSPMIEVIIGAANNTRSIIRRNQVEDVAVVPSPGIIRSNQQNLFRIVWANHVILVFRENEQWPFLVHTMIDFFNVNFYGLRTLQSRATWSIQPV
ncbi:putative Toll-like receptor 4, partial [Polypedilum vanderplanki]